MPQIASAALCMTPKVVTAIGLLSSMEVVTVQRIHVVAVCGVEAGVARGGWAGVGLDG